MENNENENIINVDYVIAEIQKNLNGHIFRDKKQIALDTVKLTNYINSFSSAQNAIDTITQQIITDNYSDLINTAIYEKNNTDLLVDKKSVSILDSLFDIIKEKQTNQIKDLNTQDQKDVLLDNLNINKELQEHLNSFEISDIDKQIGHINLPGFGIATNSSPELENLNKFGSQEIVNHNIPIPNKIVEQVNAWPGNLNTGSHNIPNHNDMFPNKIESTKDIFGFDKFPNVTVEDNSFSLKELKAKYPKGKIFDFILDPIKLTKELKGKIFDLVLAEVIELYNDIQLLDIVEPGDLDRFYMVITKAYQLTIELSVNSENSFILLRRMLLHIIDMHDVDPLTIWVKFPQLRQYHNRYYIQIS